MNLIKYFHICTILFLLLSSRFIVEADDDAKDKDEEGKDHKKDEDGNKDQDQGQGQGQNQDNPDKDKDKDNAQNLLEDEGGDDDPILSAHKEENEISPSDTKSHGNSDSSGKVEPPAPIDDNSDLEKLQEEGIPHEEEESFMRNRHFPKCKCLQKLRTSFVTGNICGKAALCYWELWNYKSLKASAKGDEANYKTLEGKCDRYMVEKHTCLIGYPLPRFHNEACTTGLQTCEDLLAKLLYDDCDPIRKSYGLPRPQDVHWKIQTESLNYDLNQDKNTIFRARPVPDHPKWNNYYTISCPVIYRYPYFTIDLLLKDLNPRIDYSETSAITGVAELIPRFAREGMNNERILNFDALSLDESYIHWCGIPRNYICVRKERDKEGKLCDESRLSKFRTVCEGADAKNPRLEHSHGDELNDTVQVTHSHPTETEITATALTTTKPPEPTKPAKPVKPAKSDTRVKPPPPDIKKTPKKTPADTSAKKKP